jgi:hypothetical protein
MGDIQYVPSLVKLGSDANQLVAAQHIAAKRLLDFDGEIYPKDGCAITLSVLLQEAGVAIKDTYQAMVLGNLLKTAENGRWFRWGSKRSVISARPVGLCLTTAKTISILF